MKKEIELFACDWKMLESEAKRHGLTLEQMIALSAGFMVCNDELFQEWLDTRMDDLMNEEV